MFIRLVPDRSWSWSWVARKLSFLHWHQRGQKSVILKEDGNPRGFSKGQKGFVPELFEVTWWKATNKNVTKTQAWGSSPAGFKPLTLCLDGWHATHFSWQLVQSHQLSLDPCNATKFKDLECAHLISRLGSSFFFLWGNETLIGFFDLCLWEDLQFFECSQYWWERNRTALLCWSWIKSIHLLCNSLLSLCLAKVRAVLYISFSRQKREKFLLVLAQKECQ